MSVRPRRDPAIAIPISLPSSVFDRLEAVAPSEDRQRSAFIREAIIDRLERIEREAADPSIKDDVS